MEPDEVEAAVRRALARVIDPEIGLDVVSLGLVYAVEHIERGVRVAMGVTSPTCPLGSYLVDSAKKEIARDCPDLEVVSVEIVREPPWTPARMSAEARAALGRTSVPGRSTLPDSENRREVFVSANALLESVRDRDRDRGRVSAAAGRMLLEPEGLENRITGGAVRRELLVRAGRAPFLVVAIASLVLAVWGGLLRLSWQLPLPVSHANWISFHGPLLVSGFLGTLIGLERSVAIGRRWTLLAPLASGAGAVLLASGSLGATAPVAFVIAAAVLLLAYVVVLRKEPTLHGAIEALGAAAWLGGNVLWLLGWPIPRVVLWWGAFLVLTVAGERLELGRLQPARPAGRAVLLLAIGLLVVGLVLTLGLPVAGERLAGIALALAGAGLLLGEFAWRTLRMPGLPRFVALGVLAGHGWLVVAGALVVLAAPLESGLLYDAALHALFLGFVLAMVFAHAPIIFPAVLATPLAFHASFYVHLALLEVSLAARVAGDLTGAVEVARWGGLGNALALALFLASTVLAAVRGRAARTRPATSR